jgi:hypothetical protein
MERELAAKKAKLEELRRAKAARQQQQSIDETGTQKLSAAAINMAPTNAPPPPHVRQQSAEVSAKFASKTRQSGPLERFEQRLIRDASFVLLSFLCRRIR